VVAGADELLQRPVHGLLGAGEGEHVAVGVDGLVGGGDRRAQLGRPPRRRVAEPELPERRALLLGGVRQELGDRQRLRVRRRQVVAGLELPLPEVDLQAEVGKLDGHARISFSIE
jgi:hypothetical protein